MAKEKEPEKREEPKKGKKKHLHQIITEQVHDGSFVHHEVHKPHKDHPIPEPAKPMATSSNAKEAGQYVQDRFSEMNGAPKGGEEEPEAEPEGNAGEQPGTAE